MSTLKTDTISNTTGTKSAPVGDLADGRCTAWVNFNGTGVVAIRDSFNVASITDNALGTYTVNFATPMANANYICCPIGGGAEGTGPYVSAATFENSAGTPYQYTTTGVQFFYTSADGAGNDIVNAGLSVFGGV